LVVNPGQDNERSYAAQVIRTDNHLDLALLRVDGMHNFPTLSLGDDEKLEELMDVVAFGFPFGVGLAGAAGQPIGQPQVPGRREYPSVSANAGGIAALRRKEGKLDRIQLDATINPGNSGGPVLDKEGKLIGVVVSMAVAQRLGRTGISYAIPVSHVRRFLTRPDIVFDPPVLGPANIHKPVLFEAKVVPLLPPAAPLCVDLILKPVPGREQSQPMEAAGTSYRVTTVPLPVPSGPWRLRLLAQFDNGLLNAITADHAFKAGDRPVRLSEVRSLQLKPGPRVALYDGKVIERPLSGLDAVPVHLGEQTFSVNLAKAAEVKFAPAVESDQVWYTLAVREADREIFRQTGTLLVEGLLPAPRASAGPTGIKPPTLEGNPSIRKLAAPVADVAVGGAGRYLVLHLRDLKKLAVFDVSAAEVKGYIPVKENNVRYAAGRENRVILLPGAGTMERWSLKTLEREVVTQLPIRGPIKAVAMGSASDGPLLVLYGHVTPGNLWSRFALLSVDTMKLVANEVPIGPYAQRYLMTPELVHVRASGNGKVFGLWTTSSSPSGVGVIVASEGGIQSYYANWDAGHVVPSLDGKLLFTRLGRCVPQVSVSDTQPAQGDCVLPACHGDYYLSLGPAPQTWRPRGQPPPRKVPITVRALSNDKPIASFPNLDLLGLSTEGIKDDLTFDKRVQLIPDARLLITIPATNDRLILRRWDTKTSAGSD
jgi:hypothetical protein